MVAPHAASSPRGVPPTACRLSRTGPIRASHKLQLALQPPQRGSAPQPLYDLTGCSAPRGVRGRRRDGPLLRGLLLGCMVLLPCDRSASYPPAALTSCLRGRSLTPQTPLPAAAFGCRRSRLSSGSSGSVLEQLDMGQNRALLAQASLELPATKTLPDNALSHS